MTQTMFLKLPLFFGMTTEVKDAVITGQSPLTSSSLAASYILFPSS